MKNESIYHEVSRSSNLWINRIIVLASFYQIKQGNGKLTIYIAERMFTHKHDLSTKLLDGCSVKPVNVVRWMNYVVSSINTLQKCLAPCSDMLLRKWTKLRGRNISCNNKKSGLHIHSSQFHLFSY